MYCRWFVTCENRAIGLAAHPVFVAVPICYRCAMRLGIHVPMPTCCVCGANVPLPHDFEYEELLYCSHECAVVDIYFDSGDAESQRFIASIAQQTRY